MSSMPMLYPSKPVARASAPASWRAGLPVLSTPDVTLRELQLQDATSLLSMLGTDEVSRFVSPPPTSPEGFGRYIEWAARERAAGGHVSFAVVPPGMSEAIGVFQLRAIEPGFSVVEWGFALGSPFWGTGIFPAAARLVVDFAVDIIGVLRLEARAVVANGRGNGALRKIGALQEGVLRQSFLRHGRYHDQLLWAILAEDWKLQRSAPKPSVH